MRPLAAADAVELGHVHVAVWREAYAAHMPADYLAALDPQVFATGWSQRAQRIQHGPDDGGRTWVARDEDGRIVGFASAGPSLDEPSITAYQLYAINVLSRAHGTGVADALMRVAIGEGGDAREATLWVVAGNARAIAFYRRWGFVDEGGRQVHEPTNTPETRLIRRLPTPGT